MLRGANDRTEADDDPRVHAGDGRSEEAIDDRSVDDHVQVVEPVLQDRERDRGRDSDEDDRCHAEEEAGGEWRPIASRASAGESFPPRAWAWRVGS